jgi:hypothetical protein
MGTVELHPGDVYYQGLPTTDWRGTFVDSTRWSDNSDATYISLDPTFTVAAHGWLPTLTGTVSAVTLHVRAQASGAGGAVSFGSYVIHDGGGASPAYDYTFTGTSVMRDSTTHDLAFAATGDLTALAAALVAGGRAVRFENPTPSELFVFEAWLEVSTRTGAPPLRQHPRSRLRKVPAPPSNRHVGGYR